MLKLYGSTTSPFVRRLRVWLANTEHEFINMEIFAGKDRENLAARNPTLKIPMLEDGEQLVFDSRVIFRYLTDKFAFPLLSWPQENQLTLIDSATDSLVQMLLLGRSDIDVAADKLYFKLQRERIATTLSALNNMAAEGDFAHWNYPAICLYCLLDWIEFRELHDLADYAALLDFQQVQRDRIEVTATDPRR